MSTLIILFAVIAAVSGVGMLFTPAVLARNIFFAALLITVGLKMIAALFHSGGVQWTDFAVFTALLLGVICMLVARLRR